MEPWRYETARDLDQSLHDRLSRFPREPDMLVYGLRSAATLVLRAWLRLWHRLETTGREHLPASGSFVMVSNHTSHLDALCLLAALPLSKLHRAFPAAAADYFFESIPRLWIATVLVNALPFARQAHVRQSLALCHALLANPGNILILFPEGTRSAHGQLSRFKPGIGALLAGHDVPVVPCHLAGAFRAWPKGQPFPYPTKLKLRIGAPRNFATAAPGKASAAVIAAELEQAIIELEKAHDAH